MNDPPSNSDPDRPPQPGESDILNLEETWVDIKKLEATPVDKTRLHEIAPASPLPEIKINDPSQLPVVDKTTAFDSNTKGSEKELEKGSEKRLQKGPKKSSAKSSKALRIVGGYVLGELLGEGGMGRVFRAEDSAGGVVALKLLSPNLASSEEALARFKQEGMIASQINHCHIVFVHRVDEAEGIPFIAMELMTGRTLKDLVLERGPLPYQEAVRLIMQCIAGLCEAHARGMIHRDIKPANCYLDEDGNIKVGDFGLARSLIGNSELTQTGTFLGTPLFAAPEQLLGQTVDTRSDIYSLTATLYYLLAGKAPFESPNAAQVIARIASSDPPSFKSVGVEVPPALEEIVMKGLSRDASKRYSSFEEMRHDLSALMAPKPETASLFRRIVAGLADSLLISTLSGISIFMLLPIQQLARSPELSGYLAMLFLLLYYWITESLFGTSLGKAALRIQVVDSKTGRKPSVRRCLARAASFILVANGIMLVGQAGFRLFGIEYQGLAAFVKFCGNTVGYLVSYWVWRKTSKKYLLHDWLSGTECVLSTSQSVPITDLELPAWKLASHPTPVPMPEFLGRFRVQRETVCPVNSTILSEGLRWFEGVDPKLHRTVWIAVSTDSAIELSQLQRKKTRTYRIRFLEEGTHETGRWFAFLAPEGVPLLECLALGVHLPWSQTRSVLQQAAHLLGQASTHEALPTSDRIWLDRRGKICLVDFFPLMELRSNEVQSLQFDKVLDLHESGDLGVRSKESSLIRDICEMAISPSDACRRNRLKRDVKPTLIPIEALLPRKARKLCQSVVAKKYQPTLSQLLIDIQRVSTGPSVVSSKTRFFNATLSLAFLTPIIALTWFYLSLPSMLFCIDLAQDIKSLQSLERLAQLTFQGPTDERDWSGATKEEISFSISPQGQQQINETLELLTERLHTSYNKLGWIEQTVWSQILSMGPDFNNLVPFQLKSDEMVGRQVPSPDSEENSQTIDSSDQVQRGMVTVDLGTKKYELTNLDNRWNAKRLRKALNRIDIIKRENEGANDIPSSVVTTEVDSTSLLPFHVLGWAIAVCAGWTWLTLGGISQYFTGICFVRRDGRRMGILQSALRALLLYLPVFLLAYWILHWPLVEARDIFWTTQLKRLFFALPLIYLATTLFRSNRTALDMITNTAAIPR